LLEDDIFISIRQGSCFFTALSTRNVRAVIASEGPLALGSNTNGVFTWSSKRPANFQQMGDFTFWLRLSLILSLSLNFGLSTYLNQKVKWFRWAKTWRLTRIV